MSHIFYTWQKLSFYILSLWEYLAESDWCCFVCEFLSNQDGSWPAHTNARPDSAPPPSSTWWGSPTSPSGTGWTLSRSCGVTRWPPGQGSKSFIRLNRTKHLCDVAMVATPPALCWGNTWLKAHLMVEQHLLSGSSFIVMSDYLIAGGNRYLQSGFLYLCAPVLLGSLHISHGNTNIATFPTFSWKY